jgi:hypothetical protein
MLQDFANKWAPLASQEKQIELMGDVMKIAAEFCDSFVQEKLLEQTKETGVLQ